MEGGERQRRCENRWRQTCAEGWQFDGILALFHEIRVAADAAKLPTAVQIFCDLSLHGLAGHTHTHTHMHMKLCMCMCVWDRTMAVFLFSFREGRLPALDLSHSCSLRSRAALLFWQRNWMCVWKLLKCPYYAFPNITFHAVCHVAVCEHKLSAKSWSRQCTINKVIVYQKKESARNRLNESLGIRILFCYSCMSRSNTFA